MKPSRRSTILPRCSTAEGVGLRNKECDEKGRFCLRGGIAHIAAGDYVGYYLRVAIRELAGPSMTIPAYNDNAPSFASIAYAISRARELAVADADGKA